MRVLKISILLVLGLLAYWLFRPEIIFFNVLKLNNSGTVSSGNSSLVLFFRNYFSDIVWCLAIIQAVSFLADRKSPVLYSYLLLSLPIFSEILQGTGLIGGTFDWIDIAIYFLLLLLFNHKFLFMQNLKNHLIGISTIVFFAVALLASATTKVVYKTGTFTLKKKEDEIFTKPSLSQIIQTSKNLSVVLRVPYAGDKVTQEQTQKNNSIYSTIEKEFAKAGFIVRDRGLFSKILEQGNIADYSKIKELTETDLILELVSFGDQKYNTNRYKDEKGRDITTNLNFTLTGTTVEFKIISVKESDLVGNFIFNYTPCTSGCLYSFNQSGTLYPTNAVSSKKSTPYEFVTPDVLENFFRECSVRLIEKLKSK